MNSIEHWARRDYIKVVGRDDLMRAEARARKSIRERLARIVAAVFGFGLIALAFSGVANAETIISKAVYDAPDQVQEATYCALALEGKRSVVGTGQLQTFCSSYGI